jgi:hypothetical protein
MDFPMEVLPTPEPDDECMQHKLRMNRLAWWSGQAQNFPTHTLAQLAHGNEFQYPLLDILHTYLIRWSALRSFAHAP